MATATLSKVGNSMAVLIPKALREEAGIDSETQLNLSSPREGVLVITAIYDTSESKYERLLKAEARIEARGAKTPPWPEGKTADDLIREAREERMNDFPLL